MKYNFTKEQMQYAKDVYDQVIVTQVLDPQKIKQAYSYVFGKNPDNLRQAKTQLYAFFNYTFKPEMLEDQEESVQPPVKDSDKTETALPEESTTISVGKEETQTHQEGDYFELEKTDITGSPIKFKKGKDKK